VTEILIVKLVHKVIQLLLIDWRSKFWW